MSPASPSEDQPVTPLPVHADLGEVNPSSEVCQRWANRQHSWVRRRAGGFDADRYLVAPVAESVAKTYVLANHYAQSYPAASRRYGLFLDTDDGPDLLGVAVFGIPAQARVLSNVFPDLQPYVQSLELSRFVLEGDTLARPGAPAPGLGRAPGNSESWFLARCFEYLAADGVVGVVSFADPVPRVVAGQLLFPGHRGVIYQASGALFTGRGTARTIIVLPDGTSLSERSLQKVRRGEQGHEYVERRLVAAGAPAPHAGEGPGAWLLGALEDAGARRLRHRGCFRYAMVTSASARRRVRVGQAGLPYPKDVDGPW